MANEEGQAKVRLYKVYSGQAEEHTRNGSHFRFPKAFGELVGGKAREKKTRIQKKERTKNTGR